LNIDRHTKALPEVHGTEVKISTGRVDEQNCTIPAAAVGMKRIWLDFPYCLNPIFSGWIDSALRYFMKFAKIFTAFAPVLLFVSMAIPAHSQTAAGVRRPRIAILDFDYATVHTYSAALFGTDVDIGKGIGDMLVNDLVKDGTYSVIERKALEKVMSEQNFSNSNRADPTSAAKLGKLLGVDAILVGSITQFGNETKKIGLGGAGGTWGGLGMGGIGHSKSNANVVVSARLVNVDTGEILAVAEGKGTSSRSSTSLLGGGSHNWSSGGGNVDFGSSDLADLKVTDFEIVDMGTPIRLTNDCVRNP